MRFLATEGTVFYFGSVRMPIDSWDPWREIQKTLRQTLKKYNLHTDQELFRKAYAYIKQYY